MSTVDRVGDWVRRYERAWRTAGTELLAELFTADAEYLPAPFADVVVGLPAIARFWEDGRDGADEAFRLTAAPVATEGDTAVVRVEVEYPDEPAVYRDLRVVEFAPGGPLARRFEEWPFFPGRPLAVPAP